MQGTGALNNFGSIQNKFELNTFCEDYDLPDSDRIEPVVAATKREREESDNESDSSTTLKVQTLLKQPHSGTYSRAHSP